MGLQATHATDRSPDHSVTRPSIALSGPTGFIGRALLGAARERALSVLALTRQKPASDMTLGDFHTALPIGTLGIDPLDPAVLAGCTAVVHTAARAHILHETEPDPLATYRAINTGGTLRLAEAAASAGVRRFVFVSSIGVLGNHSHGTPLHATDTPRPIEPYAISKAETEAGLLNFSARTGLDVVIIRPPLVHGPAAKGNFSRLCAAVHAGRLLPLGGVRNRRSFVGVANLAHALLTAAIAPLPAETGATPPIYHLADDGVISTRRLVEVLAEGMGVQPRLVSVPRWLAVGGASMLGKGTMARRLFDDLEVDDSDFRRDFGWTPHVGLEDGLRGMAEDFARRIRAASASR